MELVELAAELQHWPVPLCKLRQGFGWLQIRKVCPTLTGLQVFFTRGWVCLNNSGWTWNSLGLPWDPAMLELWPEVLRQKRQLLGCLTFLRCFREPLRLAGETGFIEAKLHAAHVDAYSLTIFDQRRAELSVQVNARVRLLDTWAVELYVAGSFGDFIATMENVQEQARATRERVEQRLEGVLIIPLANLVLQYLQPA